MKRQQIFNFVDKICKYLPTRKIPRLIRKLTARILAIKDYSLGGGERQTAKLLENIRADHTARYQVAIDFLKNEYSNNDILGYDVFCGVGYGSYMLSKVLPNTSIHAIDGSNDAIILANENYQTGKITFEQKFFPFELPKNSADFFISLESIEHIEDDELFLDVIKNTLKSGGFLIVSTPNVEKWSPEKQSSNFHYRHYKPSDFIQRLQVLGFNLLHLYGQDIYVMNKKGKVVKPLLDHEMFLKENYEGQNCVFILKKEA